MTIELGRRSFILGLGSIIAAPAIVRVSSLMPVRVFDPAYYRYLVDYSIGSDRMMLRMDKALFPLPTPMGVSVILNEAEVKAKYPEQFKKFKEAKIVEGVQKCMTLDLGFNYWNLKDNKLS
jgi:hypothetical protein